MGLPLLKPNNVSVVHYFEQLVPRKIAQLVENFFGICLAITLVSW